MSIPRSVAEVLREHVTLEVEGIDRMYLNVYVPQLQTERGVAWFFREHRKLPFVSGAVMDPISKAFINEVKSFAKEHQIPLIRFEKNQRKDVITQEHLARFKRSEGVLYIGTAQEKAKVFRTEKRRNPETGKTYPWLVPSTAMVNSVYFYCVDEDFGPFFLKFCTYFPYNAKLCINGHEYVKHQLAKEGIAFQPLDNGILSCEDPKRLQQLCDDLSAAKIDALLRKWLKLLPHPFTPADREAGFSYDISILQAEFSLTQVLDRPVTGRVFFEEVIRENLDIGRPDHVQLIFNRRVTKKTPGQFRTRVITEGVTPSLHVDYKHSKIKQYHKEGRALRTETTINDTRDFAIGKRLKNLPELRKVGFQANRRLLDTQRISHDCAIGEDAFNRVTQPVEVNGQRASALRFADPVVLALLSLLVAFRLLPRGFLNKDFREHLAPLLGLQPCDMTQGKMTYHLRRLRLHGLIERIPGSHRYRVTEVGIRTALFFTRTHARILRPGLARIMPGAPPGDDQLRPHFDRLDKAINDWVEQAKLAS
jgi:DNA-binding transcriptional ArsR family regulator